MTREKDDPEKRNLLNEPREEKKRRQYSLSKNKSDRPRSCDSSNNSEHRKRGSPYKVSSTEQRAEFQNKAGSQNNMPYQSEKKDSWWFWTFVSQQNCNPTPARKSEDTCSCVSCALKKIVSSEYACICCLLLLFTISIIVAFLVVFKSVPSGEDCPCKTTTTTTTCAPKCKECKMGVVDSERLKRKIEMLNSKKLEKGFVGVDEFRKNDDKGYEDIPPGHIDIPGVSGIDFGPSFRELLKARRQSKKTVTSKFVSAVSSQSSQNSVDENEHKLSNDIDLSNVLDSDKNSNVLDSNGKLREFYKKLVQTDAKIKSLKKISESDVPYIEDDVQKSPERSRRSLKLYHYPKRYRVIRSRRSLFGKHHVNETKRCSNRTRSKRFGNDFEGPTGLIIEKKKLLVQYKPVGKNRIPVKKCQHAPARTHTHEKQMMHPFYKNSQRLDLLLDKFLNKNLPEIMSDPFGLDNIFKDEKLNKPCKHPKPHKNINIIGNEQLVDQIPKPKFKFKNLKEEKVDNLKESMKLGVTTPNVFKTLNPESTTAYEKDFYNHKISMIGKEHKKIVTPSTENFEVMLSVSTILSPEVLRVSKASSTYQGMKVPMKSRVPNLRRLMQIEKGEEEENLGYEDFKEVLKDEMENHDEMEKSGDRKRRDSGGENDQPAVKFKLNPPQGVHNPNWKGAMPLYPDEINSMITNKIDVPKPTSEIQEIIDAQRKGRDLSDIEYVEDYLANKYNNLVQQAQAYSDYGVLDGKKESRNDKESPTVHTAPNNKIKLLADENVFKDGILDRLKRGRAHKVMKGKGEPQNEEGEKDLDITWTAQNGGKSGKRKEGIRFEFQPTTNAREDTENNIEIMKIVSKHIKLKPRPGLNKAKADHKIYAPYIQSTLVSKYPELGYNIYNSKTGELTTETSTVSKSLELKDEENEALNAMFRGNRRLLSTKFESSSDFRDNKDTPGPRAGSTESNSSGIDKFVDKLELNNNMSEYSLSLKHFIEAARQKNIKVYSTPHSCILSSQAISAANGEPESSTKSDTSNIQPQDSTDIPNSDAETADPIDTIDISSEKLGDDLSQNLIGKIVLSVNDPEFGLQNFNLMFDIPVLINSKEELIGMNDNVNYPNINYNQFESLTDSRIDAQATEATSYYSEDFFVNNSFPNRFKRESTVTATWSDKTENANPVEKYSSGIEKSDGKMIESPSSVIVVSTNAFGRKSTVSAAPSTNQQQSAVNDSSTAINSTKNNRCANYTLAVGDNMTLSDFFGVVSNWFKTLETGKVEKPRKSSGSILTDMLLTINNNSESNIVTTDSAYPMYDSDMIENIGHRSRVLLSIEDSAANITEGTVVNDTDVVNVTNATSAVDGNVFNSSTPMITVVTGLKSNITTTHKNKDKKINRSPKKEETKQKIKAIVKRNADDSNLIFWNDIYDDEYGIQTDKMDSYMKSKIDDASMDKRIVKEKDFLKRSGRWVQNKIRKFARKMNPHSDAATSLHSETKERVPRSIARDNSFGLIEYPDIRDRIDNHVSEREKEDIDEIEEDYPDVDQKSLFAALSVNMKEVCKKAAKAVQETRNVDYLHDDIKRNGLRVEESQQGSIANALMQQLVRLLTDLVDYQVQQKTCTKLTPELQTFLEWLTYNKDETDEPEKPAEQSELLFKTPTQDDEDLIEELRDKPEGTNIFQEKSDFPNAVKPFDKQNIVSPEDKTRYMDIIHSVQELMDQFDSMPDDDKSKMTGVKGYLENQMAYLNKQLSAYDLYAFIDKHDRKKRDILIMQHQTTKPRRRRKLRKFFKNFGRKHTRSTAGYNDEVQVTDIAMNKRTNKNEEINLSVPKKHKKLKKRNLKDVYYKAVAEAKKFSTAKSIHKKDEISSFGTSTVALKQH